MPTLYVTEFQELGRDLQANQLAVPAEPPVAEQTVEVASSSDVTEALSGRIVRLVSDVDCHFAVGDSEVEADASSRFLPADTVEIVAIPDTSGGAEYFIAVIEAS